MVFGRLPNGVGTISKIKQNLRKPFRARKLIGEELDERTMRVRRIYRTVGYYETRKAALEALMTESGDPAMRDRITLYVVYEKWSKEHYPTVSASSVKNYATSFAMLRVLWDRVFGDLRAIDYEKAAADCQPTRKKMISVLISQLYQYALRHEIAEKDYSKLVKFDTRHEKKEKRPFTPDEVKELWKRQGELYADIILVGLYSGFRPSELLELDRTKIKDGCFVGGMKTENGRNRLVPIHADILPIIKANARKSADFHSTRLFCQVGGKDISINLFARHLSELCPNHTPHEMRHSFATYARRSGMDPTIIKRILGHALNDVTEGVYTHVDADILIREMEKYKIG